MIECFVFNVKNGEKSPIGQGLGRNPGFLFLLFELYRFLRRHWLRRFLEKKKREKRPRKPPVLRPKSGWDCRSCRESMGKRAASQREMPISLFTDICECELNEI